MKQTQTAFVCLPSAQRTDNPTFEEYRITGTREQQRLFVLWLASCVEGHQLKADENGYILTIQDEPVGLLGVEEDSLLIYPLYWRYEMRALMEALR